MSMKKRKRLPIFYAVYFICVVLAVTAIHIALGVVETYLQDYESARPQYEAERVFAEYYDSGDFYKLVDKCDVSLPPYETTDALCRYLSAFTEGKTVTFSAITTGLDTSVRYIVKADDIKFSAFTLQESEKTTEKGFTLYEVTDFELYCSPNESVFVTAPRGYTVLVNGVALDASSLSGVETKDRSCNFMPDDVEGIVFVEYEAAGLYLPPNSVSVQTPDGRACPVEARPDGTWHADVLYSDALAAEHSDYVIEAAKAISKYMQNDAMFRTPAVYLDPQSELYSNLRTSETYFVIRHDSYDFEDVRTSEFYQYDENTFSCRISFTHVLKRTANDDYRDYIDITYFFRRVDDKFLIYDRYNH